MLTARGADAPGMTDVVVLREGTHGLGMEGYADALRDRFTGREVSLARTPGEERELAAEASVVTGVGIDEDLLAAAGDLELFACAYAGYGHLPMDALRERDVAVTNAAGIHAPSIAEQVLGYVLTFARDLHEGWRRQRNREYRHYQGRELGGSTVTVVGMGAIGYAVVERLEGFGVDTIGVRYTPEKGGPTDEVVGVRDDEAVHDALARTDYLVLATPLTDATRGLIDGAAFDTLPPESVLVNVARGGVVDTDALVHAVRKQSIRGAALDVTDPEPLPEDHPLWNFENVLLTPHNAGHTPKHWDRLADIVAENLERLDAGDPLENRVD
jgi:phosphoglycerate dehydrogenase-like enzyme